MEDRIVNIATYIPGSTLEGGAAVLAEVAGWVSDSEIPNAIRAAARSVLEAEREGEPLPYPWCWGDCLVTISGAPSQLGLFYEHGIRILKVEPHVFLLDNDEVAIGELEG